MRLVEASYENGMLHPTKPLQLRAGEHVGLIVVRRPDLSRWDLSRLAAFADEDAELTEAGLDNWADDLVREERR